MSRIRPPRSLPGRIALVLVFMGAVAALFWWRGPSLHGLGNAFTSVVWEWVAVAIAFNLLSVVARALAWSTVIRQAMPPPHPKPMTVFSAFSVGLFANAVLPGRIGELARVAVLVRKLPRRKGLWDKVKSRMSRRRLKGVTPPDRNANGYAKSLGPRSRSSRRSPVCWRKAKHSCRRCRRRWLAPACSRRFRACSRRSRSSAHSRFCC